MDKSLKPWLIFSLIFTALLVIFSGTMVLRNYKTNKKLLSYQDSLKYYKKLYKDLKKDYSVLQTKYNIAMRSALQGNKAIIEKQKQLLELQKILQKQDSILKALQLSVKEALVGYEDDKLSIQLKNGRLYVTMRNKLLFPFGSAQVQPEGVVALGQLAKVLKQNPDLQIVIEGHTDNVPVRAGTKCWKDNWDLSAARAISVARILINKYGIDPQRIEIAGRAEYDPVAPNLTEKGRALNRRIEIIIFPDLTELYKIINKK